MSRHGLPEDLNSMNLKTHTGHSLTPLQAKFINEFIETGDATASYLAAGYSAKQKVQNAKKLLELDYIAEEIQYRFDEMDSKSIASADEILSYLTSVMRGEIKDQFGLDASLADRTKAAVELAKRKIDYNQKLSLSKTVTADGDVETKIVLDWSRSE